MPSINSSPRGLHALYFQIILSMCLWLLTACLGAVGPYSQYGPIIPPGAPPPILVPTSAPPPPPSTSPPATSTTTTTTSTARPSSAVPPPTTVTTVATTVTAGQTTVTAAPTTVTAAPTTVTTARPTLTPPPTTITAAPTTVTAAPTTVTAAPTTVTAAPTTVTAAPTTVTTARPTVTAAPTTVTAAPTTPTTVRPTLPTLTPVPTPLIDPRDITEPTMPETESLTQFGGIDYVDVVIEAIDDGEIIFPRDKRSLKDDTKIIKEDDQLETHSSIFRNKRQTTTCACMAPSACPGGNPDGTGLIDFRIVAGQPNGLETCAANQRYCCGVQIPIPQISCGSRISSPTVYPTQPGQSRYGDYPWMIVILTTDNQYVGGGTLIDIQHVITAAHRISPFPNGTGLKIRAGEWDAAGNYEQYPYRDFSILRVWVHESFNPNTLQNDLALIRLTGGIPPGTPAVVPVCLPTAGQSFDGRRCSVSGWGKDAFGTAGRYQTILKTVDVPIINATACEASLRSTRLGASYTLDRTSFLCAGGEADKDACTGDGGSGLVCELTTGKWTVAGLVAWGLGCAAQGIPGVYVNVVSYLPWINTRVAMTYMCLWLLTACLGAIGPYSQYGAIIPPGAPPPILVPTSAPPSPPSTSTTSTARPPSSTTVRAGQTTASTARTTATTARTTVRTTPTTVSTARTTVTTARTTATTAPTTVRTTPITVSTAPTTVRTTPIAVSTARTTPTTGRPTPPTLSPVPTPIIDPRDIIVPTIAETESLTRFGETDYVDVVIEAIDDVVVEAIDDGVIKAIDEGFIEAIEDVVIEAVDNGVIEAIEDVVIEAVDDGVIEAIDDGSIEFIDYGEIIFPRDKRSLKGNVKIIKEDDELDNHSSIFRNKRQITTCACMAPSACPGENPDGTGLIDFRIVAGQPNGLETCAANQRYCCGVQNPIPQISRGSRISSPTVYPTQPGQSRYGDYPWMIVILTTDNQYVGAGTLIDIQHVITAAHPISPFPNGTGLKIRAGEWDAAGNYEQYPYRDFSVLRVWVHESFNPNTLQNDLALIRLIGGIPPGTLAVVPVCLPTAGQSFNGRRCSVSGWGKDAFGIAGRYQTILKTVDVTIINATACESSFRSTRLGASYTFDRTSFLCAGGEADKDACTRDEGSGLVCELTTGKWTVAGLVAWGLGCADQGVPGAYVNVVSYLPWINTRVAMT